MLDKVFDPSKVEPKWQVAWRDAGVFVANSNSPKPSFSVVLPPPNITGSLTVGHALGTTMQDVICRWKRLSGYNVLWLAGMDHAGIATQKVVERYLLEKGISKDKLGREKFLEECWKWKEKYHDRIVRQLDRLGASLDWSRETFTLDPAVSRAVREAFVRLFERGLIYRDRYIVNWCPACLTALSDEEVEMRETAGKMYYIAYPFAAGEGEIVVGTTRPETMLGDVAVAMNPSDERASKLAGVMLSLPLTDRKIPIVLDDAVEVGFGTGFLKVTPAHDPADFAIGLRHGLDPVVVIDRNGRMNELAGRFAGMDRKEARKAVLEELQAAGLLRRTEDYRHSVGYHDRCGTAIEPCISRQWFLRMKPLAEPAIEAVLKGEIVFTPERWKNNYLAWMQNIKDWCISRQLWWGHRIPVWYCSNCESATASVDTPQRCRSCGSSELVQEEDVLDTWFSSWLWTFSPLGWPDRTRDLEVFHPTDVLVTGGDIIFFWVARMIMASYEFMGEKPFSTVCITGIVRDSKGRKMSKSLGNSPDPIDIMDRYGADAFRFSLMMLSPPGQDMLFDESKLEVGRHFANKIWNASRLVLSQKIDLVPVTEASAGENRSEFSSIDLRDFHAELFATTPAHDMEIGWEERWILSRCARCALDFATDLESYRFDEASRKVYDFFWHEYCDWYLELAKAAFKEGGSRTAGAVTAARAVLGYVVALVSPMMPFISEEIWSMLASRRGMLAQVQLPRIPERFMDSKLDSEIDCFKEIVSSIRNMRQLLGVPPGKEVSVMISCERGKGLVDSVRRFEEHIRTLARVGDLKVAEGVEKSAGSAALGLKGMSIFMQLAGVVDIDKERMRLSKELEKMTRERDKIAARLADGKFIEKAPPEVIEQERSRFADLEDRRARTAGILEDLH